MQSQDALRRTLADLAPVLASQARHDWWIIASAAVALHGIDPGRIGDVDVLLDRRDAGPVFTALGLACEEGQRTGRFRSELFGTWRGSVLAVELMAGFLVNEESEWHEVWPRTRLAVPMGDHTLFVPDRAELRAMFTRFGRAKDLARAALL